MNFPIKLKDKTVYCKELSVKHYKEILKAIYGDEPSEEVFVETITDVIKQLVNEDLKPVVDELSIIDTFLVLLRLRINSMGDTTTIILKSNKKEATLELRLDWIEKELSEFNNSICNKTLEYENIKFKFNAPSCKRLLSKTDTDYLYFLEELCISEEKSLKIKTNEEAKKVFDRLPIKGSITFIKYFNEFLDKLQEINFLKQYNSFSKEVLGFVPNIQSVIWFTKLIFNESIETFYNNIYYLCQISHFNPEYIESCTPGEYIFFSKKLEQTIAERAANRTSRNTVTNTGELPTGLNEFVDKSTSNT